MERVAVIGLAVGEGELHRLRHAVDELRPAQVGGCDAAALEHPQRLEERGPLAPDAAFPDGPALVVDRQGRLVARFPAGHVFARQHAFPAPARRVHHAGLAHPAVDGLGDEACGEGPTRRLDLRHASARAFGLGEEAVPGIGEGRVPEEAGGSRSRASGQPGIERGGPFLAEEVGKARDRGGDARQHRMAVAGVVNGGFQDVAERQSPVIAQHQHPGVEGAGHDRGEKARAGDEVEPLIPVVGDRRPGGRDALPTDDRWPVLPGQPDQRGHVAQGSVQVRLHHVQDKSHSGGGVEGVAADLQQPHADGGGDPVGRGGDAEGPLYLGPGRECHVFLPMCRAGRARREDRRPAG